MRGKAETESSTAPGPKDHPRVCGEKLAFLVVRGREMGSPPRMRGKDAHPPRSSGPGGITPAYAGKRFAEICVTKARRDHPRVCGEKRSTVTPMRASTGSPPRMRGKATSAALYLRLSGITPAYAEKSSTRKWREERARDHPRVCGEKLRKTAVSVRELGSPPRMRGKVSYTQLRGNCRGITPAYAGKRLKRSRSTVPPVAIVPLFPSVCNKPVVSDGSPAGRDAPLFLPAENAVPASPACNLRSL